MKIDFLENLLGCELEETLAAISSNTAALESFLSTLPTETLENDLTPQWVVLAAGKGTRIDPTGRLSKTLDITFGVRKTPSNCRDVTYPALVRILLSLTHRWHRVLRKTGVLRNCWVPILSRVSKKR